MADVDRERMKSVAEQLLHENAVQLEGETARVRKTSRHRLKTARFQMNGRESTKTLS